MTALPPWLIGAAVALLVLFAATERRTRRDRKVRRWAAGRSLPGRAATALPRPPATPKRQLRRDVPHALYIYPHLLGGMIYVGISNDPEGRHRRRMAQFEAGDPRVAWVANSTREMQIVRWFDNWAEARVAEDALIAELALSGHSLANNLGNPLRRSPRAA